MSICNFVLRDDRVDIITDTLVYLDAAPFAYVPKIHVSPGGFAVVVRGVMQHANIIHRQIDKAGDRASAEMHLATTIETMAPYVDPGAVKGRRKGLEATLLGHDGEGAFAVRYALDNAGEVVKYTFGPGVYMSPSLGEHALPPEVTVDQLARLSLVQQKLAKKHGLLMCIGGEMHHTVVTAGGVETVALQDYPDREITDRQVAAQSKALQAREHEAAA